MKAGGGGADGHAHLGDAGRDVSVTESRTEFSDLVVAARDGDRHAEQELIAAHLPMLYRIVGRALDGHADVDDVVQETVLRAHRELPALRAPASFRSWLVAIAMRQTSSRLRAWQRDRDRTAALDDATDLPDPDAEFADVALLRLGLSAQRRQVAHAARWLDHDDQELAALWWQELLGDLTRADVVAAVGVGAAHTRVRLQRMRHQLDLSRHLVAALEAEPMCPGLEALTKDWTGVPDPRWRKRFARHVRDCSRCVAAKTDLIPMERLVLGGSTAVLPVGPFPSDPGVVAGAGKAVGAGKAAGGWFAHSLGVKAAAAVVAGITVSGGAYIALSDTPPADTPPTAEQTYATASPSAAGPTVVLRSAGRPDVSVTIDGEYLVTTAARGTAFTAVPGIAESACVSLRAADGRYVRHASFRLMLSEPEDRQLFRQDATFCPQAGADPGTVRFTSSNYPTRFIRVVDGRLRLDQQENSADFVAGSTFRW
ncbi:sigma-70 family RNA polymerase sigma factor [Actinoplanes sichuanensis]|uniref:Sigma-70 family RNA polymerase sigma factor n=1 Tax=Actinoplanes sichuanensis TaxID=512349 RepID=A0ABW4AAE4_9ACTN